MSQSTDPTPPDLESRFAALVAQLQDLAGLVHPGLQAAIPATGLVPDVVDGQLIETAWGNAIRDRAVQRFDSYAALKASWTAPADGATAVTLDDGRRYTRRLARWYWEGWIQPGSPPGTLTMDGNGIFTLLSTTPGVNLDTITGGALFLGWASDMTIYAWGASRFNAGVISGRMFKGSTGSGGTVAPAANAVTSVASAYVVGSRT